MRKMMRQIYLPLLTLLAFLCSKCSAASVNLMLTCSEECDIFVDGRPQYKAVSGPRTIRIRDYARLVAIEATQTGDPTTGFIELWPEDDGVEAAPYVSQPTWKCSIDEQENWEQPAFDETNWDHASLVTSYTGPRGERRVWASTPGWKAYCRVWMPNENKCEASSHEQKRSCGDDIGYQGLCEERGCCFDDTGIDGVPKCYYVFNALPEVVSEPLVSQTVPRIFANFGLVKTAANEPLTARVDGNSQLGAYYGGSLTTCFRTCMLDRCNSMYLNEGDGRCLTYSLENPLLLMTEPDWVFYSRDPMVY